MQHMKLLVDAYSIAAKFIISQTQCVSLFLLFTKMKLDTVDNNTWHLKNSAKAGISMKISTFFGAIFSSLRITRSAVFLSREFFLNLVWLLHQLSYLNHSSLIVANDYHTDPTYYDRK